MTTYKSYARATRQISPLPAGPYEYLGTETKKEQSCACCKRPAKVLHLFACKSLPYPVSLSRGCFVRFLRTTHPQDPGLLAAKRTSNRQAKIDARLAKDRAVAELARTAPDRLSAELTILHEGILAAVQIGAHSARVDFANARYRAFSGKDATINADLLVEAIDLAKKAADRSARTYDAKDIDLRIEI
jgi:hypothetical protein